MIETVVDELMTPGCPQCAIKHLSAALYYRAQHYARNARVQAIAKPSEYGVALAQAYINLGEVLIGYDSHLWYAVGLLQRAEESALSLGANGVALAARHARFLIEENRRGPDGVRAAMRRVKEEMQNDDVICMMYGQVDLAMEHAHLAEARRELPSWTEWSDDYAGTIEMICKEYFITDEAPGASAEAAEKGGESDMATKKAVKAGPKAAKADPKTAKAAAKGGKGGCAKKGKK